MVKSKKMCCSWIYYVIIVGLFFVYNASFFFQPIQVVGEFTENPDDLTMTNQPWVNSVIMLRLDEIANYRTYPIVMLWLILIGVCIIIYQNSKKK